MSEIAFQCHNCNMNVIKESWYHNHAIVVGDDLWFCSKCYEDELHLPYQEAHEQLLSMTSEEEEEEDEKNLKEQLEELTSEKEELWDQLECVNEEKEELEMKLEEMKKQFNNLIELIKTADTKQKIKLLQKLEKLD